MIRVALLNDYQQAAMTFGAWDALPETVKVEAFHDHPWEQDVIAKRLEPFQVVMALRERTPFPRALLERLPNLRLLVTAGMRNAAIDVQAATDLGILVCGTGGSVRSTAELTWALILAALRHVPAERSALRRGVWQTTVGTSLEGKTLGLVGLGNIGAMVAEVGRAFRMRVIAWSTNLKPERAAECGAEAVSQSRLFAEADVVSIHLQLSERSRGLIGAADLASMKPTAYLINTSRGPIVDEAALVDALRRNAIAGAGLDVFDREPLPDDHPLLKLDNVVALPHLGYVTEHVYRLFYQGTIEDILGYLSGEYVRVINPDVLPKLRPNPAG